MSAAALASHSVSKCGIVETPLIVGGQRVNENEFPHMVNGTRFGRDNFLLLYPPSDRHHRQTEHQTDVEQEDGEDLMKKADCEYSNRLTVIMT
jgi:hypothetical protein